MYFFLLIAACTSATDSGVSGDTAADADTDTDSDTDTDTDTDSDTDTDADTDSGIDTANGGGGERTTNLNGTYDGASFKLDADDTPLLEVLCQDSGDLLLRLQDPSGTYQMSLNIGSSVAAGDTVSYPNLGTTTVALGPITAWALDTTFHGKVNHAEVTLDELDPQVRFAGSIDTVWDADSSLALPGASIKGTFDISCR